MQASYTVELPRQLPGIQGTPYIVEFAEKDLRNPSKGPREVRQFMSSRYERGTSGICGRIEKFGQGRIKVGSCQGRQLVKDVETALG